jgi:type II secretory pathway pseudopilin PulG
MRRSAFTLIEMIVVLAVMMTVMAMLLPGIALMQRKSDIYSTSNVLQAVHAIQFRNARQFGSAGLVYGYTLMYTSDIANPNGSRCAGLIKPWIIGAADIYQNTAVNDLKRDIGRQMFWSGSDPRAIEFVDLLRPAGNVDIDGSSNSLPTGSSKYLHIGFSPRHGFVMATFGISVTPAFTVAGISDPGAVHQDVEIELRSIKSKRPSLKAHITSTGIIHVDGNL